MAAALVFGQIPAFGVVPMTFPVRVGASPHAKLRRFRVPGSVGDTGSKFNEKNGFPIGLYGVTIRDCHDGHGCIPHPGVNSP